MRHLFIAFFVRLFAEGALELGVGGQQKELPALRELVPGPSEGPVQLLLNRSFSAQKWGWLDKKFWMSAADEAMDQEFDGEYEIWGGDIDPSAVELARHNAQLAEVDELVLRPVAPLVEPGAGGIQHKDRLVPHDGELHLMQGPRLREGAQAVLIPQTAGCCVPGRKPTCPG